MFRREPAAGIGDGIVVAVTSIVLTVLAVVTGGLRRVRDAVVRTGRVSHTASPARPPAATTTGLGGAST